MADLERMLKTMQQLKRETLDFNSAIADVSQATTDFIKAGSRLTGSGTRAGTVWSLISRLSVGTGFHRVEANIRSITFILKFINQTREKEAKADQEAMKTANMVTKYQMQSMRLMTNIAKLRDSSLSVLEKETILNDENVKFMVQRHGEAKAILKIEERTELLRKNSARLRRRSRGPSRSDIVDQNRGFFKNIGGLDLEVGADLVFAQQQRRDLRQRKMRVGGMVRKGEKALARYDVDIEAQQQRVDELPGSGKQTKIARRKLRRLQRERDLRQQQQDEQEKMLLDLQEEDRVLTEDIVQSKEELKKRGYNVSSGDAYVPIMAGGIDKEEGGEQESLLQKFLATDDLKKMVNFLKGKFKERFDKVTKFFTGGSAKKLAAFVSKGAIIFGKVLLWVALLGVIVYLLQRTGVIDKIAEVFREGKIGEILKNFWDMLWSGVGDIVMGVWGVLKAVFGIIKALYMGEGLGDAFFTFIAKLAEGLVLVARGLFKILIGYIGIQSAIISGVIQGAVLGIIGKLQETRLGRRFTMSKEDRKAYNLAASKAKRDARRADRQQLGITSGSSAFIVGLSGQSGSMDLGSAGMGMAGMANGGFAKGGMTLVGERGPELVQLPAGARVFSNTQTKRMGTGGGNVINVHVNGRVGASESELNELARKIGEKINREMTRFGSSGLRGA